MSTVTTPRWDPDALADLEHERDVLLRELRELDGQLLEGELTNEQHATLSDDICARAAEVIVLIERGKSSRPRRARRTSRIRLAVIGSIATAAAVCAWLLIGQAAPRENPAVSSDAVATPEARMSRLADAVAEHPDDLPARLAYARMLIERQDLAAALEHYDAAAATDPTNAEALAYGGWLAVLTGQPGALERLDRAVAADPRYPDAHALRGLALMRAGEDEAAARDLNRYLQLAPDGALAGEVRALIDRLGGGP